MLLTLTLILSIKSVTEMFSELIGMITKTAKIRLERSWLPDLEVCWALHGAETRHFPGLEVGQMTAMNTNAEDDLDRAAFGRVLEKEEWPLNEPKEKYRKETERLQNSKWADGKHKFNRQS